MSIAHLLNSRLLLWALLAAPAVWLLWRWGSGALVYGEVVSRSGIWGGLLLIPTTAVTPVRLLFSQRHWLTWLIARRGDLGVAAFAYAGAHAAAYVIGKDDLRVIFQDARQLWLLAGWAALLIFLTFAATTDDDAAVRILRQSWRSLHRFGYPSAGPGVLHRALKKWHRVVYIGAALVFAHWALSAFDPLTVQVQASLHAYGYYSGPIDGIIGSKSRDALTRFQHDHRLPITGSITPEVLKAVGIIPN
jgi:sulfoxide reductase heme-binding subunit YedZ